MDKQKEEPHRNGKGSTFRKVDKKKFDKGWVRVFGKCRRKKKARFPC